MLLSTTLLLAAASADPCASPCAGHAHHVFCYPANVPAEVRKAIIERNGALPPTLLAAYPTSFFTDDTVWTGDLGQGPAGQALPARLTYSFPDDGTTWGLSEISAPGPNTLNAELLNLYGAGNLDLGREYLRQSIAVFRKYGGLTYAEVADDGSAMDQDPVRTPDRGDIRIGGLAFGTGTFLAYNAFPSPDFAGVGGGDMVVNTSFFLPENFSDPANDFRYLRNTIAHEHGHGTGYIHSTPCDGTKLMEPFIDTTGDTMRVDGRRGLGNNYGDRFAGNQLQGNAEPLGTLTRSVILPDLSTNGDDGPNNSDEDWFSLTVAEQTTVSVTVQPTGGSYQNGQQFFGCFGDETTIDAFRAGNLNVEIRTFFNLIASGNANGAGEAETATATLNPGVQYLVRVVDIGPSTEQDVQLYDLTIDLNGTPAAPWAVAGLDKRIAAGETCFFIGDILSEPTQPGATLVQYDWDLDGNGSFEVIDDPRPTAVYTVNGTVPVTLRVTDSNGVSDTDTITVTVFGGSDPIDCPDADGDGFVNIIDLNLVLSNFNMAVDRGTNGDVTGDGFVDLNDLNAILSAFDTVCD